MSFVQYVLLPDYLIKNSVRYWPRSRRFMTRDRRPCCIVDTRPITTIARNDAVCYALRVVLSITKEEERTSHSILNSENYATGNYRALFETFPAFSYLQHFSTTDFSTFSSKIIRRHSFGAIPFPIKRRFVFSFRSYFTFRSFHLAMYTTISLLSQLQ